MLTDQELSAILRNECAREGGIRPWARLHDISPGYVCSVLGGSDITPRIANALGYAAVTRYVPVTAKAQA
jgi:hypothetical protein